MSEKAAITKYACVFNMYNLSFNLSETWFIYFSFLILIEIISITRTACAIRRTFRQTEKGFADLHDLFYATVINNPLLSRTSN